MRVLDLSKKLNIGKRVLAQALVLSLSVSALMTAKPMQVQAADKKITMKAARSLSLQNSKDYESAEDQVLAKQSAYESSVKAIGVKQENLSTFRWSPLISFKFPTDPSFAEASEFQYKPLSLAYDIRVAQHQMQDKVFEIDEKVNTLYCEIVVLQETLAFNNRRSEAISGGIAKNEAKLRIGEATKADVDKLNKKKESTDKKIASDRSKLEADLKKLSDMMGLDVTTGYTFEKPFVEATLTRSMLPGLTQYTLDRDETYYEACVKVTTTKAELTTNSGLVKNKFGGDYNIIGSYVNSALNGIEINKKAFKAAYKEFIKKIDSYWEGEYKILFFSFPKLWFKGEKAGSRYIEDDPNALETNVLDHVAACTEKEAAKKTLEQSITDSFNNYISVRNSYKQYLKDVDEAEKNLARSAMLNRAGQMSFEEYDSEMDSFEELQNSMLDAMKLYTTTLYSFDRLTCGGVSALLSGTDADMQSALVGESYTEKETADGAYYTLKRIVQNQEFELSVVVPEETGVTVTDYELWVDGILVGDRTPLDNKLRHLALTVSGVEQVKIRLYNEEEFIDDCVIDPSQESGKLTITTGYAIKKIEPDQIGTYELNIKDTGIIEITFKMDNADIKKYKVFSPEGKELGYKEAIDIDKTFKHISAIQQSIEELKLEFYDESEGLLYKGRFDVTNGQILKEVDE